MKRISPVPVLAKRKQRNDKAETLQAQSSNGHTELAGTSNTTAAGDLTWVGEAAE